MDYIKFPFELFLPSLFSWKITTEWSVDSTCTIGTCDENGWTYDMTWDRLLEASRKGEGQVDFKGAMVRRRRWIRSRVCVSEEAKQDLQTALDLLTSERSKIEACLLEMHSEYNLLMQYEKERGAVSEHITNMATNSLTKSISSLKFFLLKLGQIKQVTVLCCSVLLKLGF